MTGMWTRGWRALAIEDPDWAIRVVWEIWTPLIHIRDMGWRSGPRLLLHTVTLRSIQEQTIRRVTLVAASHPHGVPSKV